MDELAHSRSFRMMEVVMFHTMEEARFHMVEEATFELMVGQQKQQQQAQGKTSYTCDGKSDLKITTLKGIDQLIFHMIQVKAVTRSFKKREEIICMFKLF